MADHRRVFRSVDQIRGLAGIGFQIKQLLAILAFVPLRIAILCRPQTVAIGFTATHLSQRMLAHMLRGQAYLKLGKRDDALADFEAEVERDSTNDRAWLLVGQVRKLKKDEPGALIAFCKAKELGAKEAAALCPDGAPK